LHPHDDRVTHHLAIFERFGDPPTLDDYVATQDLEPHRRVIRLRSAVARILSVKAGQS
jgi:hypothetical protein